MNILRRPTLLLFSIILFGISIQFFMIATQNVHAQYDEPVGGTNVQPPSPPSSGYDDPYDGPGADTPPSGGGSSDIIEDVNEYPDGGGNIYGGSSGGSSGGGGSSGSGGGTTATPPRPPPATTVGGWFANLWNSITNFFSGGGSGGGGSSGGSGGSGGGGTTIFPPPTPPTTSGPIDLIPETSEVIPATSHTTFLGSIRFIRPQEGEDSNIYAPPSASSEPTACTRNVEPVCGYTEGPINCTREAGDQHTCTTPAQIQKTYSNLCFLDAAGATFVRDGDCQPSGSTGGGGENRQ